ncbi:MAG: hypothetical protein LBS31_04025, partial [Candidatus Adiutrix sp.]|nr:hypothetical protein [Candidatus Adiutrix sp.]
MARNDKKAMELAADPRLAAFRVLEATEGGRRPEEALNECGLLLSARDMSLATALVYEVLRHRSRLDWLMETRLKNGRAAGALRQTLRLGLAQLLFFDRLGDHAVVMETVALAKAVAPGRQGVVNAILRGLLRDRDRGAVWPPEPPASGDAVQDLARRHSFPPWLTRRMVKQLGAAEAEDFFRAANRPTPPTLRINPLKATGGREEVRRALPFACLPTALSPWGLAASVFAGRPEQWPGFAEGRFALQDEASQLAGLLAGSVGDGAILDACSGLGGKALLLASIFPQARLTAMDRDPAKLEALTREAARLGCAAGLVTETRDLLAAPPPAASFDLALLDAPCS